MVGSVDRELDTADAIIAAFPKRLIDLWILTGYRRYIKARQAKPVKGLKALEARLADPAEFSRVRAALNARKEK